MFIMDINEVEKEIKKINEYLSTCSWMDFELASSNGSKVTLAGALDQTYNNYLIEIEFEEPFYVSSFLSWKTDTNRIFIELANKEEEFKINTSHKVEIGNYIFKLNVEDFEATPCIIIAKKITCKIIK